MNIRRIHSSAVTLACVCFAAATLASATTSNNNNNNNNYNSANNGAVVNTYANNNADVYKSYPPLAPARPHRPQPQQQQPPSTNVGVRYGHRAATLAAVARPALMSALNVAQRYVGKPRGTPLMSAYSAPRPAPRQPVQQQRPRKVRPQPRRRRPGASRYARRPTQWGRKPPQQQQQPPRSNYNNVASNNNNININNGKPLSAKAQFQLNGGY